MNRSLYATLLPLLLFIQTDKSVGSTVLLNEHLEVLSGRVKQIIETSVSLRGGPLLIRHNDTLNFDKKGHQVGYRVRPAGRFSYLYQSKNTQHGKQIILLHPDGNWKRIYKYGSNGHILETLECLNNETYQQSIYTYDPLGRVTYKETSVKKSGECYSTTYYYNNSGYLTEERRSPINKKDRENIEYHYLSFDKKGNWTTQTKTNKVLNDNLTDSPDTIRRKITYY
jgi:hypothetical protein